MAQMRSAPDRVDQALRAQLILFSAITGQEVDLNLDSDECILNSQDKFKSTSPLIRSLLMGVSAITNETVDFQFDQEDNPMHENQTEYTANSPFSTHFSVVAERNITEMFYGAMYANKPGAVANYLDSLVYGNGLADQLDDNAMMGLRGLLKLVAEVNNQDVSFDVEDNSHELRATTDYTPASPSWYLGKNIPNIIADLSVMLNAKSMSDVINIPAPVVNVEAPVVNVEAPVVNVEAPVVNNTVEVSPTPVTIEATIESASFVEDNSDIVAELQNLRSVFSSTDTGEGSKSIADILTFIASDQNLTKALLMLGVTISGEEMSLDLTDTDHPIFQTDFSTKSPFRLQMSMRSDLNLSQVIHGMGYADKPGLFGSMRNKMYGTGMADVLQREMQLSTAYVGDISLNSERLAIATEGVKENTGLVARAIEGVSRTLEGVINAVRSIHIEIPRPLNFAELNVTMNKLLWIMGRPGLAGESSWMQWFLNVWDSWVDPPTAEEKAMKHIHGALEWIGRGLHLTATPGTSLTDIIELLKTTVEEGNATPQEMLDALDAIRQAIADQVTAMENQKIDVHVNNITGGGCE